jgi:hypothetical protein
MEITIPVIPAGFAVLLNFFSPYIVSLVGDYDWAGRWKKLVAVLVSLILTVVVFLAAWAFGAWTPDLSPPGLATTVLLALATQQAAYGLVFKESADEVMRTKGAHAKAA